jgi:molybdopterin converting factor small subunit
MNHMRIKLRAIGFIAAKIGSNPHINIKEGSTLGEAVSLIFKKYNLGGVNPTPDGLKINPGYLKILLNGKEQGFDLKVKDGDEITILPPLIGG